MKTLAIRTVCSGLCLAAGMCVAQVPYTVPGLPPTTANTNAATRNSDLDRDSASMRDAKESRAFHRVKDLLGSNVKNTQGEELGEVEDIILNPQSGDVFAVIEVENDRQALVPVQALKVSRPAGLLRNAELTLNMSKQSFLAAPTLAANDWASLDDPGFTQKIYSHYRVDSPSAMGAGDSSGGTMEGRESNKDHSLNPDKHDSDKLKE